MYTLQQGLGVLGLRVSTDHHLTQRGQPLNPKYRALPIPRAEPRALLVSSHPFIAWQGKACMHKHAHTYAYMHGDSRTISYSVEAHIGNRPPTTYKEQDTLKSQRFPHPKATDTYTHRGKYTCTQYLHKHTCTLCTPGRAYSSTHIHMWTSALTPLPMHITSHFRDPRAGEQPH